MPLSIGARRCVAVGSAILALALIAAHALGQGAPPKAERIANGRGIFEQVCAVCHQLDGKGLPPAFPPLAGSDYLNADKARAVRIVIGGLQGPIVVNGETYNGLMPAQKLSDDQAASALTYVYSAWGNMGHDVTPEEVAAQRKAMAGAAR